MLVICMTAPFDAQRQIMYCPDKQTRQNRCIKSLQACKFCGDQTILEWKSTKIRLNVYLSLMVPYLATRVAKFPNIILAQICGDYVLVTQLLLLVTKCNRFSNSQNQCDRTIGHLNSVDTTSFRVLFFLFFCFHQASTFCMLAARMCPLLLQGMHDVSIVAARNAWVSNFVCLCVMENRSCAE